MTPSAIEKLIGLIPEKYQQVARQFIKFGVTGTIGSVVDFGTYAIITRLLQWEYIYFVFGYPLSTANNISVFLAIVNNFLLNKYWTFRHPEGNIARQWAAFFSMSIVTWSLNQILMSYFAFQLPLFENWFGDAKDLAAKVAAILLIMMINFLGIKFLIFRKK